VETTKISHEIRAFLLDSFPHEGKPLLDSTDLLNDWFVDSLGIIMTVVFLEKTFKIEIKSIDVNEDNFKSIDTLTHYVLEKKPQP
jgi:acyl carrier protein